MAHCGGIRVYAGEDHLQYARGGSGGEKGRAAEKGSKPAPKKAESGEVLFGKLPKDNHRTDISELTLQSGTVSVTGKVFAADSRKIQKTNAAVLSFDMTDYTGSIHVSKYIRQGDDQSILR